MIYLYDGSFEGFLCVVYESYYSPDRIEDIQVEEEQLDLLPCKKIIPSQRDKAQKVYRAIETSISSWALQHTSYAFLSELPGMEMELLHYLHLGFRKGSFVDQQLTNIHVKKVLSASQKTASEHHAYLGLLRFQLLNTGIYYAPAAPKANIVPLLAPHFSERLPNERWVIHDTRRNFGVLYDKNKWHLADLSQMPPLSSSSEEQEYQLLWKTYYDHIAIAQRKNPKLRQSFMPQRYWQYLTEMQER